MYYDERDRKQTEGNSDNDCQELVVIFKHCCVTHLFTRAHLGSVWGRVGTYSYIIGE